MDLTLWANWWNAGFESLQIGIDRNQSLVTAAKGLEGEEGRFKQNAVNRSYFTAAYSCRT